jgi:hypothetical protein
MEGIARPQRHLSLIHNHHQQQLPLQVSRVLGLKGQQDFTRHHLAAAEWLKRQFVLHDGAHPSGLVFGSHQEQLLSDMTSGLPHHLLQNRIGQQQTSSQQSSPQPSDGKKF